LEGVNDLEVYSVDIEQAFTQSDKLPEGVNGRYFVNPPPGRPDTGNRDIVHEVERSLHGNASSPKSSAQNNGCIFQELGF
jgi:hypothetical protein